MFNSAPTRISGGRGGPSRTLRLLVALLVVLQLATPVGAAIADPAPAAASHLDHIGSSDDPGCGTFHDDAYCMSCGVFFTPPLRSVAAPSRRPPLDVTVRSVRESSRALPDGHGAAPLRARAPPRP